MGKVYRDKPAIPIPDGLKPCARDSRVLVSVETDAGRESVVIGYAAGPNVM